MHERRNESKEGRLKQLKQKVWEVIRVHFKI
jgi:septum formation topological specificity factor MinE